jgi:hypothetical protein
MQTESQEQDKTKMAMSMTPPFFLENRNILFRLVKRISISEIETTERI